jgi:hypothetical protein
MQPKYMESHDLCRMGVCTVRRGALRTLHLFGWVLLVAFAVLPPLVVMRLWKEPVQTTSQSIQEVLRMTTLRATAAAYGVQRPEARRTEVCMTNLMMQLSETICDERGWFHPHSNETDGLRRRDADRISSFPRRKETPMKNNTNQQRNAISGWEGEGGAVISDESGTGIVQEREARWRTRARVMRATSPTCAGSIGILTRTRRLRSRRRDATETISKGGLPADWRQGRRGSSAGSDSDAYSARVR